jgi:iron complex transport system substrate-binding protein
MIDKEKLLDWDPDIIIIDQGGYSDVMADYQKNTAFYESLSAVKNSKVFGQLPYNYYSTNIDTAIADCYFLGKTIYPDAFADVDPVQKADEIYQSFLGKGVYDQMAKDFNGFGPVSFK